jgi:hypothetical protein
MYMIKQNPEALTPGFIFKLDDFQTSYSAISSKVLFTKSVRLPPESMP